MSTFSYWAEIPAEHVKELLTKSIENELGSRVGSIEFKFKTVTTGYGPAERDERVFDGVKVNFVER